MTDPQLPAEHPHDPEEAFPADDPGAVIHDDEQDVEEEPDLVEPSTAMFGFLSAAGVGPPVFSVPLDCKDHPGIGHYRGTTYPGHSSYSVDVNATDGHDIGDAVFASADGIVYRWEPGNGDMRIRHAGGFSSWYVHMQHPKVAVGDKVKRGQQIAELGNAGIGSTGPHLHVNHAGSDGKQIQVVWDGVPYPASVSPNTKDRVGPLIEGHCQEVDMRVVIRLTDGQWKVAAPAGVDLLLLTYDPATDRETSRRTLHAATPLSLAADRRAIIDREPKGPPYGTFYRLTSQPGLGEWLGQRPGVVVDPVPGQPTPAQRKAILAPVRVAVDKAEAGG